MGQVIVSDQSLTMGLDVDSRTSGARDFSPGSHIPGTESSYLTGRGATGFS